jgi:kinesin family protein 5
MSEEKEAAPSEDSIRVVCRFRPLNDTEERTGSKFIVKFPSGTDDQCVSIGVRFYSYTVPYGSKSWYYW